ncbi:hypothetical protein SARC_14060, partial [Sphaeroforma arctica JP610]
MESGQHSGLAGGIVPETFTIARILLDRLENSMTGVVVDDFNSEPNADKIKEAQFIAGYHGNAIHEVFNLLPGVKPMSDGDLAQ